MIFRTITPDVHDQLDDLTELLKNALNDNGNINAEMLVDENQGKNPGKIDQSVIDSLQNKTEEYATKQVIFFLVYHNC